jgi:serine/threonine-protein kinase
VTLIKKLLNKIGLDIINGYRYVGQLGGGKASVVCLYENEVGSKQVVKMLIAPRSDYEFNSFKSEQEILVQLNRFDRKNIPNLVSDLVHLSDYSIYYYIMEYIDGVTLSKYIENNPLPWNTSKAIKMICCITSALSKTSRYGIVHRDLHPGNIMLKNNFNPDKQFANIDVDIVLLDYGCHKDSFHNLATYFTDSDY